MILYRNFAPIFERCVPSSARFGKSLLSVFLWLSAQGAVAGDDAGGDGDAGTTVIALERASREGRMPGTEIEAAIKGGETARAGQLIASLPPGAPEAGIALLAACRAGEYSIAALALAADADPNDPSSPLTVAAERNEADIVELLLNYGADASLAPRALPAALHHRNAAMASLLLNAGADPNFPDANGVTPLGTALSSGGIELARLMFRHGGYPDDFVEAAMQKNDTALLTALFEYGISPNATDVAGNPLLVRAAMDGKVEIAKLLMENGADPKKHGREGQAALHFAAVTKNEPLLRVLIEGGADPNQPFASPVRAEFLARIDDESFKKWLQRDTGLTAIMLAASRGDTGMIRLLVEKGARRGLQTKNWQRYPVVFACDAEHIPAAQILLGRDPVADEPELSVTICLSKQRATLYKGDEPMRTCRVSTGRKGFATRTGKYVITDKQRDWVSTIYKVSMPFFMRLSCMEIGMHAGNCPGYPASHGCIRIPRADAQALYSMLKIGDAVTIEE